jgi:hypothetical protein
MDIFIFSFSQIRHTCTKKSRSRNEKTVLTTCFVFSDHISCWLFRYLKEDSKGWWQCITTCWHCRTNFGTYSDVRIGQYNKKILLLFLSVFSCTSWHQILVLQYWADENLNYPIYFLTYVSSSTIDYVKSFLEWMSDSIAKSFEQTRENIFLLK